MEHYTPGSHANVNSLHGCATTGVAHSTGMEF